jgi:hypothetical protein
MLAGEGPLIGAGKMSGLPARRRAAAGGAVISRLARSAAPAAGRYHVFYRHRRVCMVVAEGPGAAHLGPGHSRTKDLYSERK